MEEEKGQGLAEFALVLPLLIILLMGIFDLGRLIYVKIQVQHLTAEIHKLTALYHEEGTVGGIKSGSMFQNLEDAVDYLLWNHPSLEEDKISYQVDFHSEHSRYFERYNFDGSYGRFFPTQNRHDVEYLTVRLEYDASHTFVISPFLKDEYFIFSHEYTGLIYKGSDGYDR